jgi:hypothetical protein
MKEKYNNLPMNIMNKMIIYKHHHGNNDFILKQYYNYDKKSF